MDAKSPKLVEENVGDVPNLVLGRRKPERKKWQSALEICAQPRMPGEGGKAAADREGRVRCINPTELMCGA